jgi:hypothetical protein
MSGGSMDYLYSKIEYAEFKTDTVLRRAMRQHLWKVAAALKAIEWNDSGDGANNEDELIRACLPEGAELELSKIELEKAMQTADSLMQIWGMKKCK